MSYVFCTADVINEVNNNNHINVTYPWNDNDHVFLGVPPHAALLQELRSIRADQLNLIENFVDKVKEALEGYGVNADRISEQRLRLVLDEFRQEVFTRMGDLRMNGGDNNNSNDIDE